MPAPIQHNQSASRRPISGAFRSVAEAASLKRFDSFHDKDWSFDPDLRTPGFRKPKTRKRRPKVKSHKLKYDEVIEELIRRGVTITL